MIKLNRAEKPAFLTDGKVAELTKEFKETRKAVWDEKEIRETLAQMSHNKCAYCECRVDEEAKYMEVEHFRSKDSYPDQVVEWVNLLPACKRCNVNKGSHDVVQYPIVNPFDLEPRDHLEFWLYRFRGKTTLGEATEEVLCLNDTNRLTCVRFEIGERAQKTLEAAAERLEAYRSTPSTRRKNKLVQTVLDLLEEAQPKSEFASTVATVLSHDTRYGQLKDALQSLGLWSAALAKLNESMQAIAYELA